MLLQIVEMAKQSVKRETFEDKLYSGHLAAYWQPRTLCGTYITHPKQALIGFWARSGHVASSDHGILKLN